MCKHNDIIVVIHQSSGQDHQVQVPETKIFDESFDVTLTLTLILPSLYLLRLLFSVILGDYLRDA